MTAKEQMIAFAQRHLTPYALHGSELIPEFCPVCHGGERGDRHTFALNIEDGVYVCKRGTCGVRGRFEHLAELFGERAELLRPAARPQKQYELPEITPAPLTGEIVSYFERRKISRETLEAFRVGSDAQGNILFPFYRDGALVYVKYRAPRKPQGKERKEWQASKTRPILFGMDLCSFAQP